MKYAARIRKCTPGMAQEIQGTSMGYGHLYHALVRLLRPKNVLVIGSGMGFTPAVIAGALEENKRGKLTFVDPSFSRLRDGLNAAHGGQGSWDTPKMVRDRFSCVSPAVADRITHYKLTNTQFFSTVASSLPKFDMVVIDGAHDSKNVAIDWNGAIKRLKIPGYILLHDSTHFFNRTGHFGVAEAVKNLGADHEVLTLPGKAGLTVVRVVPGARRLPVQIIPPQPMWQWAAIAVMGGFILGKVF